MVSASFDLFKPPHSSQVEAVVQEAVYDAGVMPQYLRVDFLVDKQGVVSDWSWAET